MNALYRSLSDAAEEHDFEVDQNAGTVTVEFEAPKAKFVVSPNTPVRQIWLSALTRSFKFDWNEARGAFVLAESGLTLAQQMAAAISTQLGEDVRLS